MAAKQTTITLTHGAESYQTIVDKLLKAASKPVEEMVALRNFFHAAAGEDRACKAVVHVNSGDGVKASSTVTIATGVATDTAVVSGTTFTCVDHRDTSNVTFGADSGGSLNSKYFLFQDQGGANKYYLWLNINNAGVDPAPVGRIGIKVAGATGATAATLATAAIAACGATTGYSAVTFAADSGGSLNSKYFKFKDKTGKNRYYFWLNINGAGVDPAPAGYVGIQVAGATGATAATLATAAFTAAAAKGALSGLNVVNSSSGVIRIYGGDGRGATLIDGTSNFVMSQEVTGVVATAGASGHVIFTDVDPGVATTVADGPASSTGFTFTHSVTGSAVSAVQYNVGASDTLTAVNLAAAINANSAMAYVATATSAAAVVTVSSYYQGPVGNYITLTASGGNTAGAATLASGAIPTTSSTVTTYHAGV